MSNVYIQFCEEIPLQSEEEVKWVGWHLGILAEMDNTSSPEEHPDYDEYCRQMDVYQLEDDLDGYNFEWDITWDDPKQKTLVVYSDESGSCERAARFIQQYLHKFHSEKCMGLEWSMYSDRASHGSSMGGAAFITSEKIEWVTTEEWLLDKAKEFNHAADKK